jgi:hypothetical protein
MSCWWRGPGCRDGEGSSHFGGQQVASYRQKCRTRTERGTARHRIAQTQWSGEIQAPLAISTLGLRAALRLASVQEAVEAVEATGCGSRRWWTIWPTQAVATRGMGIWGPGPDAWGHGPGTSTRRWWTRTVISPMEEMGGRCWAMLGDAGW